MQDNILLIEDKLVDNFNPITLTKTSMELQFGKNSLYNEINNKLQSKNTDLFVRKHLIEKSKKIFRNASINKIKSDGDIYIVNSLINPNNQNINKLFKNKGKFIAKSDNKLVCAKIPTSIIKDIQELESFKIINKILRIKKYPIKNIDKSTLIKFPWELLKESYKAINNQFKLLNKIPNQKINKSTTNNKKLWISKKANLIDKNKIFFDTNKGPIIIDDGALIEPFSFIMGPTYIGKNTKINGARIYSKTSIGNNCIIGGEIEGSIIHEYTNKAHLGYIGHSIIGSWVNIGALTTNSNLKNTYGKIKINIGRKKILTNEIKYGCMIGDNVKTSIGSLIFTGINIGPCSQLYGYTSENIPAFTIYNNLKKRELIESKINKIILTQSRVMKRRNISQTNHDRKLLRDLFKMTNKERKYMKVKKGVINI